MSNGRVKNPCTACLDGKYPTDVSESSRFAALRSSERGAPEHGTKGAVKALGPKCQSEGGLL